MIAWNDMIYMQEMTHAACASQPTPAAGETSVPTKTLIDIRDKKTYTIAKLKDGNCWMTDNLALEGGTTLTIEDSDLDPNVYINKWRTYTLPVATTSGFSNTQVNDKNGTATYPNQQVRNPVSPDANKYGAYYSWCVATAGTCLQGAYADIIPNSNNAGNAGNAANTTTLTSGNASSSICPKGWQLPVNGNTTTDKSYGKLLSGLSGSAGSTTMQGTPYNFVYGGFVDISSLYYAGSYGYYWSSTAYSATVAYRLSFSSSGVYPSSNYDRYFGLSARCVAR